MPRRPTFLAREFSAKLALLEQTRAKVEVLFPQGHLDRPEVEAVYAGLFIDGFTEFEALIERLFLGLFDGSFRSVTHPATRLFRVVPKAFSRPVVFDGDSYVDWLPVQDRTIPRAKRFLDSGIPFSSLTQPEKQDLKSAHLLRNALAHKSDAATKHFLASINQQALLPHETTPPGYLRSSPQGPNGLTQFGIKMNLLSAVAQKLCA
jgi:hypothetical protein